jgi:hypothetical protein
MAGAGNSTGRLEEPERLNGKPPHPDIKRWTFFAVHAVSHARLVNNHEICEQRIWTRHGTDNFLDRRRRNELLIGICF